VPHHHECVPHRVVAKQGPRNIGRRLFCEFTDTVQFTALAFDCRAQPDPAVFNFGVVGLRAQKHHGFRTFRRNLEGRFQRGRKAGLIGIVMVAGEDGYECILIDSPDAESAEENRRRSALVRRLYDTLRLEFIEFTDIEVPMYVCESKQNLRGRDAAFRAGDRTASADRRH